MQSDFPKCLEPQFYSLFFSHCSNFTFVKVFLYKQWKRVKSSRADQRYPPNGTVAHGECSCGGSFGFKGVEVCVTSL